MEGRERRAKPLKLTILPPVLGSMSLGCWLVLGLGSWTFWAYTPLQQPSWGSPLHTLPSAASFLLWAALVFRKKPACDLLEKNLLQQGSSHRAVHSTGVLQRKRRSQHHLDSWLASFSPPTWSSPHVLHPCLLGGVV